MTTPRNNNPMLMSAESLSAHESDPCNFLFFRNNAKIYYITYNKDEKLTNETDLLIYVRYIYEAEFLKILTKIGILYRYINNAGKRRENEGLCIIYRGEKDSGLIIKRPIIKKFVL